MRNVLANIPKAAGSMVASIIRTVFAQPDREHVHAQFDENVRMLTRSHPKVADMLEAARDDLLAFTAFPFPHWRQIWSTNPLERTNRKVERRTDPVGKFPNPAALLRLAGHVLIEQHDEWGGAARRYFSERSMALLLAEPVELAIPELTAAKSQQRTRTMSRKPTTQRNVTRGHSPTLPRPIQAIVRRDTYY